MSKSFYLAPFLHFMQKFKIAAKNGVKIFCKQLQMTLLIPCGSRILSKSLSLTISKINMNFAFYTKIQGSCQKWRETNFWGNSCRGLCGYPGGQEFPSKSLYLTFSKINIFLHITQKFNMPSKWRENNFSKKLQVTLHMPFGPKILSNRFQDKYIFAFYPEIQDGHQKWRENDFWQTVADDSVYTLRVKKFIGVALADIILSYSLAK